MENKITNKNWDLSKVSNDQPINDLIDLWLTAALKETSLRKNAIKSLQNFKKWWFALLRIRNIDAKTKLIYNEYKNLDNPTDAQKDWIAEMERAADKLEPINEKLPSIYQMLNKNKKLVLKYLNQDKDLAKFKIKIQLDYFVDDEHRISDEDKKISDATWGTGAIEKVYDALRSDIHFDIVRDENDKVVEEANSWSDVLLSWNETVRKNGYISWNTLERKHRKTLYWIAMIFASRLQQNAKYYHYNDWIEQQSVDKYFIEGWQFAYIIEQTPKFAELNVKFRNYVKNLICGVYDLKQYKPWDFFFKIPNQLDSINIEQAKQLIINGLSCLGPEYIEKLKLCYAHNIIMWDKSQQTEGEGFCLAKLSQLDEHPIRFNWDGSSISTTTLAHELGHNIRKKFMKQYNEVDIDDCQFLEEIPSIINSVIMNLYLLREFKKKNAPKEQIYGIYYNLIEYLLKNITLNGYRLQLANTGSYGLVEKDIDIKGFELNAWKLKKDYFGLSAAEYKYANKEFPYWLEVLDCYRVFMSVCLDRVDTLQYYIGSILGLVIGTKIFNGDKNTLKKYYKFLKSGTSLKPIALIKSTLGIDFTKPQVYTEAKQILNRFINDFIKDVKVKKQK